MRDAGALSAMFIEGVKRSRVAVGLFNIAQDPVTDRKRAAPDP